jgi:hypothetical protein
MHYERVGDKEYHSGESAEVDYSGVIQVLFKDNVTTTPLAKSGVGDYYPERKARAAENIFKTDPKGVQRHQETG